MIFVAIKLTVAYVNFRITGKASSDKMQIE